jgi:hypothetical protein
LLLLLDIDPFVFIEPTIYSPVLFVVGSYHLSPVAAWRQSSSQLRLIFAPFERDRTRGSSASRWTHMGAR